MPPIYLAIIVLYTAVFAMLAIVSCLLVPGGRTFAPLARVWSRLILRTCNVRTRAAYHPEIDPSRPVIYMANHQSQFDIPALIAAMPSRFKFIAKRELLWIPIFGWALWLAGFILIPRGDHQRAVRSLEKALHKIRRGTSIIVFPEGTRSPDGRLLPFKKGGFVLALKAAVPIVPVSIRGGHRVLPKGSLRIRPGVIDLVFGSPIDTTAFSLDAKEQLMETVRRQITLGLEGPQPPLESPSDPPLARGVGPCAG